MSNLFLTLVIAFVIIVFLIALLAIGWLMICKKKREKTCEQETIQSEEGSPHNCDVYPSSLIQTPSSFKRATTPFFSKLLIERFIMYRKDSPATIQSMFNSIANSYDRTNAILSLFLHKRWNRALIKHVQQHSSPVTLLDLCSGTGDIAFGYLQSASTTCQAYLVDFSSEMLEYAQNKARRLNLNPSHTLSYLEADVQHIPLPDQFADYVTMAYGIRNVQDPALCIHEAFRILKLEEDLES